MLQALLLLLRFQSVCVFKKMNNYNYMASVKGWGWERVAGAWNCGAELEKRRLHFGYRPFYKRDFHDSAEVRTGTVTRIFTQRRTDTIPKRLYPRITYDVPQNMCPWKTANVPKGLYPKEEFMRPRLSERPTNNKQRILGTKHKNLSGKISLKPLCKSPIWEYWQNDKKNI